LLNRSSNKGDYLLALKGNQSKLAEEVEAVFDEADSVNYEGYALGLMTRLGLLPYIIATYLFMLPGAIAYTYLGYVGREAVAGGEGMI
jgi:hypothetical protein